ncbi:MAG: flagellar basal body rod protein FlgC [Phycisphaerae bacterium]
MFGSLDISTSALMAQRTRLNVIAGNIANMQATRDADGNVSPFQRRVALLATGNPAKGPNAPGVHVQKVMLDSSPPRKVYEPGHPDAIQSGPDKGYVLYPNVDYSTEMINALTAARAYEANVTVTDVTKSMAAAAMRLMA